MKEHCITENHEFAMQTNEIYKTWSGMKASEYKQYKGIRKESLRDNMTDIESKLGRTVISNENSLSYNYEDDNQLINSGTSSEIEK